MGKLLNDHDRYPGWIHQPYWCRTCGEKWISVHHIWMNREFLTWCPNCPAKKAELNNVVGFDVKKR